jgi:hypothetical protein
MPVRNVPKFRNVDYPDLNPETIGTIGTLELAPISGGMIKTTSTERSA